MTDHTTETAPVRPVAEPAPVRPWAIVAWAVAGACLALVVSAIGVFTVPVGVLLVVVLLVARRFPESPAVLVGAGALPLYVAWLNRTGPGRVCSTTATTESCFDATSPWPWVAVGLVLVVGGALLAVRTGWRRLAHA
ncbi:hypothetical protein [Cellulomonas massiliensis]|uniref:hypothetical protein n=1 Tax=Cellulomonas massiliensis TaxID=1465811 RepID=UPI0003066FE5|nr:hypothetical protein [Cellulomonas massiliensis]